MKNKTSKIGIVAVAALVSTILFYKQGIGINAIIFSIIAIGSFIWNKKINSNNWLVPVLLLINGFSLCLSFQWVTLLLFITSFFILIGARNTIIQNYLYKFCQGFTNAFSSGVNFLSSFKKDDTPSKLNSNTLIAILATLPVLLIFFLLYSSGNPVFTLYLSKIDLSFIDFGSIFFFAIAAYFCVSIFTDSTYGVPTTFTYHNPTIPRSENPTNDTETTIFTFMFIALCFILSLFHLSDVSLIAIGHLPEGMTMTEYLHQGFWTLVVSVILSVILVLIFFRDQLGYHTKSKKFQTIASLWLSLNALLLFSTAIKNTIYVLQFGLTYKRIAVYAFLGIALIAIITCFIKIFKQHLLPHFIGKTMISSLLYLSVLCVFPWDAIITNYNLSGIPKDIDSGYLLELNNNFYELITHIKSEEFDSNQRENILSRGSIIFQRNQNINWQEWNWQIQKEKSLPMHKAITETIELNY